ncbi:VOC family protein [Aestuariimicrobium sp. Y1814]|uniref:VOC family protein n=1 Tax=Aestuariimicrobium sp. Y1814 TaxID=3418742 RepID=UPI003DA71F1D
MADDASPLTARQWQRSDGLGAWRVLGEGAAAWFTTPSHRDGAALAARAADLAEQADRTLDADVRAAGVRVRLPTSQDDGLTAVDVELARAISATAADRGFTADPGVLQDLQVAVDALDRAVVAPFWARVLGYRPAGDQVLADPLRRNAAIWFQGQDAARPLRNRLHVDAVTTAERAREVLAEMPGLGASAVANHGYYATVADAEGNEVDLLPLVDGADRWEGAATEDWRLVFSALACYRVEGAAQAGRVAEAAAALADRAGLPLGIDLRPGLVVLDTGKDRWETDEGYEQLAAQVQVAARDLGAVADVALPRFHQVVIDAVDIPAVRRFWQVVLGYAEDPREGVTDLVNPHQLTMPVVLQDLEADDTARRAQRNRIHLDLFVPDDQLEQRLAAALAAGGTVVRDASPTWWTIADPEGNEVDLTTSVGWDEVGGGQ